MRFDELDIGQRFSLSSYPECVALKMRETGPTCCTPPRNAKLICIVNEQVIEQPIMVIAEEEVTLIPDNTPPSPLIEIPLPSAKQLDLALGEEQAKIILLPLPNKVKGFTHHSVPLRTGADGGLEDILGNPVKIVDGHTIAREKP